MAINEDQEETLQYIFDHMNKGTAGVMTDWERSFMEDQKTRYDEYGTDIRFSPKQWAIIERIESALTSGKSTRR